MKLEDIHVGDILRVREWQDMESEFGLDGRGGIKCPLAFVPEMKYLCGKVFTIANIDIDSVQSAERYECSPYWENSAGCKWHISPEMLEPISEYDIDDMVDESYEPISVNELRGFLSFEVDEVNNES